ncbi:MAG: rhodanese-like domain-containing protein [Gammaproteobacteria bacterium]|nr:rhodanese-like domain-containing protein [Gammaproteobacteria bacterium]MBU1554746.1 rhodanese-like domain-containing protein [Gammaproteobacteria bacterium]MBU2071812.1 rhodanese-like domain-containing protein [Gammaproteobacteria bacterium]MBU2181919.1 rhodanese-like domain-containing protein [Gammaproteobacteria bacterium]MBU2205446.1 rhodanese-like domain-containing protein [Gammaproteobacteria bacterium]
MRLIILSLLLLCSCAATKPQTVWLDVRSAEEFAAGHLSGAINIPHTEVAQRINELKLAKDADIALYCKSGRRAGIAMETLQQLGYTNLSNHGGYDTLKQKHVAADERQ